MKLRLKEMQFILNYRASVLRWTMSFVLLKIERQLGSGPYSRLLGRLLSSSIGSRSSSARSRSLRLMFTTSTT